MFVTKRKGRYGTVDNATATTQDTLPEGQSSAASQEQTPKTITLTEEEYKKALDDASARGGRRFKAEMEKANSQLSEAKDKLRQTEERLAQMEDEGIKEPDLKEVRAKIRRERAELTEARDKHARAEAALAADKERIETFTKNERAKAIADQYQGGNAKLLLSRTDGSEDDMEDLARSIWQPKKTVQTKPITESTATGKPYFTRQQFDSGTPEGRAFWEKNKTAILEAIQDGRVK